MKTITKTSCALILDTCFTRDVNDTAKQHSSIAWVNYYEDNSSSLLEIPRDSTYTLNPEERSSISKSIAEFQRGESSEGKHLLSTAKKLSITLNDPEYLEATVQFIKEEQRHAIELKTYMDLRKIPVSDSAWSDSVFRTLRHLGGIEISICVLVVAEIIAQSYYRAMRKATVDPILIKICDQIISDEDAHVKFQTERIASLRHGVNSFRTSSSLYLHRFLFFGTLFVVWKQHYTVYSSSGIKFLDYWQECWHYYWQAESNIRAPGFREAERGRHGGIPEPMQSHL